ncbi:MAG: hsdS [Rhodocyclaceae bacterium]|nr:hsdS [Rhodocyclaceae bacterium]
MKLFPDHWQTDSVSNLCIDVVDCVNKTAPTIDGPTEFKMIRTTNVKSGRINLDDCKYVDEATFAKWTRRIQPKRNDIVLTREAPLGEVGLLRSDEKVFLGQRTMLYRANPKKLDQRFLYYSMLSPLVQGQIRSQGSGATVEHLRVPDAESFLVAYPPLEEQRKIAALLSAYDDLIANNQRRIALLESMAEEIYREWFVRMRFPSSDKKHSIQGVPMGWKSTPLRSLIAHYIGGGWGEERATTDCTDGAYVFRGTDLPALQSGEWDEFVYRFHKPSALVSRRLEPGDFVFEVSGGSTNQLLGRNLMVSAQLLEQLGEPAICASFCKLIRFDQTTIAPLWMKYFLKMYYDCGLVGLYQVQSTGISNYQFEAFISRQTVLVPDRNLQSEFCKLVKPLNEQRDSLARANRLLKSTRDVLLPRLISGKLHVDPLDIQYPRGMMTEVE